jgi:hypothetical protein
VPELTNSGFGKSNKLSIMLHYSHCEVANKRVKELLSIHILNIMLHFKDNPMATDRNTRRQSRLSMIQINLGIDYNLTRSLDLSAGYSRSVYSVLNTFSFGIGVNVSSLLKRPSKE